MQFSDGGAGDVASPISVQSNSANGRITDLSPLAAANVFVRYRSGLIDGIEIGRIHSQPREMTSRWCLMHASLNQQESVPQTASRSVHPFLRYSSPVCPTHRHAHRHRPHYVCACGRIYALCVRCGLKSGVDNDSRRSLVVKATRNSHRNRERGVGSHPLTVSKWGPDPSLLH